MIHYSMVLTTVGNTQLADNLIQLLLEEQLAACIQTMPISSHYIWEGKVCHDQETLLIIKTKQSNYAEIEALIVNHHDYDVPQIVMVPFVDGLNPYLAWIDKVTKS